MYLSRLDHLRFFAAFLLVVHHFRGNIGYDFGSNFLSFIMLWLNNGSTGVSLFLVLSGYLFCILCKAGEYKIVYSKFIKNRILRIFPLLTILFFCILCVSRRDSTPMDILRLFTLQLNTGHSYTGWGHNYYPSGPIWTIAVEFQFYLIFPFLILFFHQYGFKYIISLIAFMLFLKLNISVLSGGELYNNLYHTIVGRLDQFCVGIIFGWLCLKKDDYNLFFLKKNWVGFIFIIFLLSILTFLFVLPKQTIISSTLYFLLEALCWGGIIITYQNIKFNFYPLIDKFLAKMGSISFSIYLLHLPIGVMIMKLFSFQTATTFMDLLFQWMIIIPTVFLISFLSYYVIEKPFMSLRVKYLIKD